MKSISIKEGGNVRILLLTLLASLTYSVSAFAQEMNTSVYGYVEGYAEKVDTQPEVLAGGAIGDKENVVEYDVPSIHLLVQSTIGKNKAFLNLDGGGGGTVGVANAWVERSLVEEYLNFRFGKMYRPFGLYNEILDATPTYIGIEAPELFDGDHLLLTRETNLMLHGRHDLGDGNYINYALTTGNDQRMSDELPLGGDLNYTMGSKIKTGVSFYTSGGPAKTISGGGVLPWMSSDSFTVFGGYFQFADDVWTVQAAYYTSDHKATRDVAAVTALCTKNELNTAQRTRFNCGGTINEDGDYEVSTYYTRIGYTFDLGGLAAITPYFQYDVYENPEVIYNKADGGDAEAGLADDGMFTKLTLGTVYRPLPTIAMKLDYSQHLQEAGGKADNYGEIRFSFSYLFRL